MSSNMPNESQVEDEDLDAFTEELFREIYKYQKPEEESTCKRIKKSASCSYSTITTLFPILKWLPKYNIRRDILGDIIAGLTVAVMHIPHGLAYAPLAGQAPVVGLYMAVFPTIVYIFLGTSRHISLGTFAVVCMMVGKTVSDFATPSNIVNGTAENITSGYSNLEVGVTVCFLTGLWQLVMGVLHLGSLWLLLSNSLVSGFTTGAAVHVATYQIKNLLGVPIQSFNGPLKWVYTVIELVKNVPVTNLITLGLSICSIFLLSSFNELGKPRIQKRFPNLKVPVPMELIVILLGIAVSYFLNLEENYGIHIVKTVPVGMPEPIMPIFSLFSSIWVDCFVIGVVGISMSMSLAAIFAKKGGYEINQNQELISYGASNMFAAFFQCVPCSASLSRSLVQSSVGGKTQIAGIFTMITIIFILLFLGPVFEPVPYSVLSSIVIVTLKGLLWQVKDFPQILKYSKLDGLVWMVTFLAVVLIDLDIGLGVGLLMSVLSLVLRGQGTSVIQLGKLPQSNLFMDVKSYKSAKMIPNILLLKVSGVLNFANFSTLYADIMNIYREFQLSNILKDDKTTTSVILELSCVPSLDPTAVNGLTSFYKDLKPDNCQLILTDCNSNVYDFLEHCKFFDDVPKSSIFVSINDAVDYLSSHKNTL